MVDAPWTLEKLVLDAEGVWRIDGEEVTHARTVNALHRGLIRIGSSYQVKIGTHSRPVEIEDTPCFVAGITWETQGPVKVGCRLSLADGSMQALRPETLTYRPTRLACRVKTAWGEADAKFLRGAYHEFLRELQEDPQSYTIEIDGKKLTLSRK